jgi:membrane associated rhomboid family serine protease
LAALVSGAGTWIFGAPGTLHIGASGVIFGYFGYLVTRAWFDRSIGSILVSLLVILMFGGMIWGIAPIQRGISWEGHLFGLLGGVGTAWLVTKINQKAQSGKL